MLQTALYALVPEPDESQLRPGLDPSQVTPGLLGFLMTLFMVIAVILLMRSMVGRVRRVRYREQALEDQKIASQPVPTTSTTTATAAAEAEASSIPSDASPVGAHTQADRPS